MAFSRMSRLLAFAFAALLATGPAAAAVFTVTTAADSGAGSLREAITLAEANGEADLIELGAFTIGLASQLPTITTDITIRGEGWAHSVIDGGNPPGGSSGVRAFTVDPTGVLVLDGVDVRNCYSNAVYSEGQVSVISSRLESNRAVHYGGAIFSYPPATSVTLQDSSFIGNEAMDGGAIVIWDGDLHAVGCTFSANAALGTDYPANGGAIRFVFADQVTLTNCTVTGNHANDTGGGLFFQAGVTATVDGLTIADNTANIAGGGIYLYDYSALDVIVSHTIIDGDCASEFGATITSAGHNLESGDTCGLMPALGDLVNSDPQLLPLQDYGGPTPTRAPAPGSPAVDAGATDCGLISDQRGWPRPIDGDHSGAAACDIGAAELQDMVFWDGFESGDLSFWLAVAGG